MNQVCRRLLVLHSSGNSTLISSCFVFEGPKKMYDSCTFTEQCQRLHNLSVCDTEIGKFLFCTCQPGYWIREDRVNTGECYGNDNDNTPIQYTVNLRTVKIGNFHMKKCDNFLIFAQNIDRVNTHFIYISSVRGYSNTDMLACWGSGRGQNVIKIHHALWSKDK